MGGTSGLYQQKVMRSHQAVDRDFRAVPSERPALHFEGTPHQCPFAAILGFCWLCLLKIPYLLPPLMFGSSLDTVVRQNQIVGWLRQLRGLRSAA